MHRRPPLLWQNNAEFDQKMTKRSNQASNSWGPLTALFSPMYCQKASFYYILILWSDRLGLRFDEMWAKQRYVYGRRV